MASEIKRALLGRLAINAGLITQDQVLDCLNEQQKIVREKGTVPHLGDILLQKGYLTKDQVQSMLNLKGSPEALPEDRDFSLFGDYEIMEKIDSDASGTVYMARNQKSDEIVDLKILSRVTTRSSDFQERFVNESKRGIGLKHPNIKQMLSAGCLEGRYYYVSEHVEGSSLSRILGDNKKLSVEGATRIILGAAAALRHAHQNGVVHGDVRPSHIFVAVDGTVKLAEFGVLKDILRDVMRLMGTGETVGYYIAPEQVVGDRKIDGRADIYSLGAAYYHLLLGKPPHNGNTPFQCLVRFCIDHITHPNAENQSIPRATSDIVMKMIEPEPDERYQSITQLEDALENIYSSGGTVIVARAAMQEISKPKGMAKKKKKKTEASMVIGGAAKKTPVPGRKIEGKKSVGKKSMTGSARRRKYSMDEGRSAPPSSSTGKVVAITTIIVLVVAGGLFGLFLYWQSQQGVDTLGIMAPRTTTVEMPEPVREMPEEAPVGDDGIDTGREPAVAPKPKPKQEEGERGAPASLFAPPGWDAANAPAEEPVKEKKEEVPVEAPADE